MQVRLIVAVALLGALSARAEEPCVPVKPCEVPDQGPGQAREVPADFAEQARQLGDLLGCQGRIPAGLDPAPVKAFCARQAKLLARSAQGRAALQAALQPLRPARLPSAAVFPLSGSDLLRVLAAYPDARNITLTSDRGCGDPRLMPSLREPGRLAAFLSSVADEGEDLLRASDGASPGPGRARWQAGALPLLLWALAVDGDEPVGLKFGRVEPAGTLRYLGAGEIASMEKAAQSPFESCEVAFVRRGEPAGTLPRLARNLRVDLSDAALASDSGPLMHLESKGSFVAVLAGATAVSGDGFSRLRELLLRRAVFAVSDGSGPTPEQVRQARLVQESPPRSGAGASLVVIRRP
jgi:hypothetical protein